jgi:hypothetical protein
MANSNKTLLQGHSYQLQVLEITWGSLQLAVPESNGFKIIIKFAILQLSAIKKLQTVHMILVHHLQTSHKVRKQQCCTASHQHLIDVIYQVQSSPTTTPPPRTPYSPRKKFSDNSRLWRN